MYFYKFYWNHFHSDKYVARYTQGIADTHVGFNLNVIIFSYFSQNWNV